MKFALLKAFELIGCRRVIVSALGGNTLFKVTSPDLKKHKHQLNEIGRLLMSYGMNSSVDYQETDEGPCIIADMNGRNTVTYEYPVKPDPKPYGRQEWTGHDFSYWGAVEDIVIPGKEPAVDPAEDVKPQDESLPLVTYVRKNINKLKALFLKPLGYPMVEKMLQQELNLKPGVAQLICPIVNQRVDLTLTDTTFKQSLDIALRSPALKKEWDKKADVNYLSELPQADDGFQPAYDPVDLDFNPVVAQRIADQISFGYETLDTWNVPEAPSERQQIDYIKACLADESKFAQRQRQALYNWVKDRDEATSKG
jgi:hypothetical protein